MVKEPEKPSKKPSAGGDGGNDRKARLAEALRANLRRRKEARKPSGASTAGRKADGVRENPDS